MRFLILVFYSFLSFLSFSQRGNQNPPKIGILTGIIIDSISKNPIEYASIRLFSVKDSTVSAGIYSSEKGEFILDQIPLGKYYLKITFAGYASKSISNISFTSEKPNRDMGLIKMDLDAAINLEEVKVIGRQELLKMQSIKKSITLGRIYLHEAVL
jgi:hypothetical protein